FARIELESVDTAGLAHLSVPTRFLKSWIQSHYADRIVRAFQAENPDVQQIELSLRTAGARAPAALARAAASAPPAKPGAATTLAGGAETGTPMALIGSPIDRRLGFDTFLVGRSNALAHAAAREVANSRPGEPVRYNPLYVHAAVGLGKTHLLHAIAGQAET